MEKFEKENLKSPAIDQLINVFYGLKIHAVCFGVFRIPKVC
jgi:hypothetical protein